MKLAANSFGHCSRGLDSKAAIDLHLSPVARVHVASRPPDASVSADHREVNQSGQKGRAEVIADPNSCEHLILAAIELRPSLYSTSGV
ncbi:hypothetical protein OUZ56_021906 [Daphnia magna]|uniref:Uncharacterized protein n=1 Tax=Daphnia magna TaxID=35525 RepID=A0ABR0AUS3_9CRUS|nr:hypothetical protein OUZ56_021906 [Daphnia magna]